VWRNLRLTTRAPYKGVQLCLLRHEVLSESRTARKSDSDLAALGLTREDLLLRLGFPVPLLRPVRPRVSLPYAAHRRSGLGVLRV
jgi:hypothetical protein